MSNDDDEFVTDIEMSVAKKERRTILKRMWRGKVARAESGLYVGGKPPLGYELVYENRGGQKPTADYVIKPDEAEVVKIIFDTLKDLGGNVAATAKALNAKGYRGKKGQPFVPNTIKQVARRKLYIGIMETTITDKIIHRPDLQIVTVIRFEQVQELIKSRSGKSRDLGRRGKYIFTGFVGCSTCGGAMAAGHRRGYTTYECTNRRKYGKAGCPASKTYTEHIILPPVVNFLTEFIQNHFAFRAALDNAAAQYGKTITEEAIEATISGELASVQASKQRLVEAISLGILTNQEAAGKLAELREHEQRLSVEMSNIAKKAALLAQWQSALDVLKGEDIERRLYKMAKKRPISFRRLLSMVFEPNSLYFQTGHKGGHTYEGVMEKYTLTPMAQEMIHNKFVPSFWTNKSSLI